MISFGSASCEQGEEECEAHLLLFLGEKNAKKEDSAD